MTAVVASTVDQLWIPSALTAAAAEYSCVRKASRPLSCSCSAGSCPADLGLVSAVQIADAVLAVVLQVTRHHLAVQGRDYSVPIIHPPANQPTAQSSNRAALTVAGYSFPAGQVVHSDRSCGWRSCFSWWCATVVR